MHQIAINAFINGTIRFNRLGWYWLKLVLRKNADYWDADYCELEGINVDVVKKLLLVAIYYTCRLSR